MRIRAPRLLVPVSTLALALSLAGCDVDDTDGETAAAVEDAERVVVTDEDDDTDVVVEDADGTVVVAGSEEAAEDLAEAVAATRVVDGRTTFSVAVDGAVDPSGVTGEGTSSGGDLHATMLLRGDLAEVYSADGLDTEVIVVADMAYLSLPTLLAEAGLDATWVSAEVGDPEADVGSLVTRARLTSPAAALALLDGASNVAELEEEFVEGEEMTHYVATVELAAAVATGSPAVDLFAEVAGEDDRALEVHAHVDDEGLVRRMEATMDQDGTRRRFVVEVREIGTDTLIEPPPAGEVATFAELVAART